MVPEHSRKQGKAGGSSKVRPTSWKPGQSGNPAGKPPGISMSGLLRKMLEPDFPEIMKVLIDAAKSGDQNAIALLLSRTCATLRPQQLPFKVEMPGDSLSKKALAILDSVSEAKLSPTDAKMLLDGIGAVVRIQEMDEIQERLALLERKLKDAVDQVNASSIDEE